MNKISKKWLYKNYVVEKINIKTISKLANTDVKEIIELLKKYNIKLRTKTQINHNLVLSTYEKLKSVPETAKQLNCSTMLIYKILRDYGYKFKKPLKKLPQDEIIKLYESDISAYKISRKLDIPQDSVLKILKENKTTRSTGESLTKYKELLDEDFLKSCTSIQEICDKLNCGYTAAKNAANKFNIKFDKKSSKPRFDNQDVLEDKEKLKEYVLQYPTLYKLILVLNRKRATIKKYIIKHELMDLLEGYKTQEKQKPKISKEKLKTLYIDENKSAYEIGKTHNIHTADIIKALKFYDIPQKIKTSNATLKQEINKMLKKGVSKSLISQKLKITTKRINSIVKPKIFNKTSPKLSDKKWLEEELKTKTPSQLAQELNVTIGIIDRHIRKHKIRNTIFSQHDPNSQEYRDKISTTIVNNIISGKSFIHAQHIKHESHKAGTITLKSNLEKDVATKLDEDESVKSYKYEKLILPYNENNRYVVDFDVESNNGRIIIEVKGHVFFSNLIDEKIHDKLISLDKYCQENQIEGIIITENETFDVRHIIASFSNEDMRNYFNEQEIVEYLLKRGFLYPHITDEMLKKEIHLLINNRPNNSTKIHARFFNHFWSSNRNKLINLRKAFLNESIVQKSINRIIKDNNPITENRIIREMERCGASKPSVFKPQIARAMLQKYKPKSVLDPCMGWGGRLVSTIGLCKYFGFDINNKMILGNQKLIKWLKKNNYEIDAEIKHGNLLKDINCPQKVDMIFTSPPFGNTEYYNGYNEEYKPLKDYIDAIFKLAKKYLNPNGIILIHTNTDKIYEERIKDKIEMPTSGLFGKKSKEFLLIFS